MPREPSGGGCSARVKTHGPNVVHAFALGRSGDNRTGWCALTRPTALGDGSVLVQWPPQGAGVDDAEAEAFQVGLAR